MATGTILFDMAGAIPADGTGSGNNPPAASVQVSASGPTANTPFVTYPTWLFDSASDEHLMWSFRMPENYASGGTLKIIVANAAAQSGTNAFVVKSALSVCVESANFLTQLFSAPTLLTMSLINNQGIHLQTFGSLALSGTSLDSASSGQEVILFLGRDADHASDTATGDMVLIALAFEYVTT